MTEQEWLTATDPERMLEFLQGKVSDRKLRLFACACFRRIWRLLENRCREAVDIFERFANGQATAEEFANADQTANAATDEASDAVSEADAEYSINYSTAGSFAAAEASYSAAYGLCYVAEVVPRVSQSANCAADAVALEEEAAVYRSDPEADRAAKEAGNIAKATEKKSQALLVRDVFGNRFRPATLNLSWLTPTVEAVAQAIYDNRQLPSGLFDNQRMGVLADALEEAGCDNADILNHCRQPGQHVRGCWVIDHILGKE